MASTAANRAAFINNVLNQLKSYGFDGIDIDWEYPGTERGGAENDGENFLSLLKEFEAAIDTAGRPVIISFTAPASYWYLQQFPIVEMAKHVNWINLMTYVGHSRCLGHQVRYRSPSPHRHSRGQCRSQHVREGRCPIEKRQLGHRFLWAVIHTCKPQLQHRGLSYDRWWHTWPMYR